MCIFEFLRGLLRLQQLAQNGRKFLPQNHLLVAVLGGGREIRIAHRFFFLVLQGNFFESQAIDLGPFGGTRNADPGRTDGRPRSDNRLSRSEVAGIGLPAIGKAL